MNAERKIRLGHISGVFGIKGWVKVHSDTHPRENIVSYRRWYLSEAQGSQRSTDTELAENERSVELESGRPQGKTIVAKLRGTDTPEQARALVGQIISVAREDLPALEDGEYYWADLIGFEVRNTQGLVLGEVDHLFPTGANDVLVVRVDGGGPNGNQEILIPWVRESVILEVALTDRLIRVDWDPDY